MAKILPKNKAPGVDICGTSNMFYIIRSDLGFYVETSNLNTGSDMNLHHLHPSCTGGEHYLADYYGNFFVIKGDSFRKVSNLSSDSEGKVFNLHSNCQGGDHYLSFNGYFYIIFKTKSTYHKTTNLTEDTYGEDAPLQTDLLQGLYYWGSGYEFQLLKPIDKWAVEFSSFNNFNEDATESISSFSPNLTCFLPAGLAVIQGKTFARWEKIKTVCNDSSIPITWNKKITKKVGYVKETMSSVEKNWKVAAESSITPGPLTRFLIQFQLSLSTEFGGSSIKTDKENWEDATTTEETLSFTLQPKQSINMWQYTVGLGKEIILFSQHIKVAEGTCPPSENPIAYSEK